MSKERSPARSALAAAIQDLKHLEEALAENAAKQEIGANTRDEIYQAITALETEHPFTRSEIDAKRVKLQDLNEQWEAVKSGREALAEEERTIRTGISYAMPRIEVRAGDVLKDEVPFADMIAKYRSMAIEAQNRFKEISSLLSIAGYGGHMRPEEFIGWSDVGPQTADNGPFAPQWIAWRDALKKDPDAPMPA